MQRRSLLALVALGALAACDKQPAGPAVEPANSAALAVNVQRDTALGTTPKFAPASNIRVSVFFPGDTLPMRQANTDSKGNVLFIGLEPGDYIVSTAVAAASSYPGGRAADTVTIAGTPADTVRSDTIGVRLGGTMSGTISADTTGQIGRGTAPFAGVVVALLQQHDPADPVAYDTIALDTTDATGRYTFAVAPGVQKYRVAFDAAAIPGFFNDTLLLNGTGTAVATRGPVLGSAVTIAPGGSCSSSACSFGYRFNTRIGGAVFRDADGNGALDAGEGLVAGDTVFVQLRNAAGDRVISSVRLLGTNGGPVNYSFTGLFGGSYQVGVDFATSKFADPKPVATQPATVTLANSLAGSLTQDLALDVTP